MVIVCLDLEGVLFPEIWINIALKTKIPELKLTTRDISDYDKLMQHRLKILKEKSIKYSQIKEVISTLKPLPGAKSFFNRLKEKFQVAILSDTYYQFAMPLMKQIDYPILLCHNLEIDENDYIKDYKIRIKESKKESVLKFKALNFKVIACGDSYNDVLMLKAADKGIFFSPPKNISEQFPQFPVTNDYNRLFEEILKAEKDLLDFK